MIPTPRTHYCGHLRAEHIGSEVTVCGWVNTRRDHGGVVFVDLRDHTGLVQVVFKPEVNADTHREADPLRNEYVLEVRGRVEHRESGNVNPKLDTGEVEILAETLTLHNASLPPVYEQDGEVDERVRLEHRYYDLRGPLMQRSLRARSKAAKSVRDYLSALEFVEVETPVLTRSTPEGARDYLVPSRVSPGSFYALPQSPQLFKQILMIGGFDRYYQIVKCFRDEDLRGNRQPEFTQIDIEMAFIDQETIIALTDGMIAKLWKDVRGIDVPLPIPRMTYAHAMEHYGSDAPDLRFELPLIQVSDLVKDSEFKVFRGATDAGGEVKAIRLPGGATTSRKELDDWTEFVGIYGAKGMAWVKRQPDGWQSPIAKFFTAEQQQAIEQRLGLEVGDLVVFCADSAGVVADALGNLRKEIARRTGLLNDDEFNFVWVTDFPMFEASEDKRHLAAKHHPFTSPVLEDLEAYGDSEPLRIRARAYDIVLNGVELGGGSIRIHRTDVQSRVFEMLGLGAEEAQEKFGFLLDALQHGAPPHGGIAFGFDRIMMFLVGTSSIRDVIAFPKTQRAADLMVRAPAPVSDAQLTELGLRLRKA